MWWDQQNLGQPRVDKTGARWHFAVWHDLIDRSHVARVFFWDDQRSFTGVLIIPAGGRTDVQALHDWIQKLAADPALRNQCQRALRFPLERHYSFFGAFPEQSTEKA